MTSDSPITVMFCCATCSAGYRASQTLSFLRNSGTYFCQVCRSEVHSWYGDYDYVDWRPVETMRVIRH